MNLVPVYVNTGEMYSGALSQDEHIQNNSHMVTIYYVDVKDLGKVTGDDWDDSPAYCNADPPYRNYGYKVYVQKVFLGKPSELKLWTKKDD